MTISKRQIFILFSIAVLLAVPFVAMQFSSEVNWSLYDFIGASILLSIIGFTIDFVLCKTRSRNKRSLILLAIFILFLLVWIELAVGLFNTPFAGN
ncbi:hypothetical protein [Allomuricauda sp.]|uniref:hypothetical protein n=1 Tax=Flagellimonas alginolytica TaxID=3177515 RepID=UPI0025DC9BAB|nr:hypothetical protein [Allomuricauda sp.]